MDFLADESADFVAVRALRAAGHNVLAVAEVAGGASDSQVIELGEREDRILLTEDSDFGRLVFAQARKSRGVIFIRYPAQARSSLGSDVVALAARFGDQLGDAFVVLQPGRARISRA